MSRSRVVLALALTALLASPEARAYCYYNTLTWMRGNAPLEAIPVYLDFGPVGDLRRTGLSGPTLISYTLALIGEVNRSAATAPRLYFGGIRRPDRLLRVNDLPDGSGIHIRAALCSSDDSDADGDGNLDDDPDGTGITSRGGAGQNKALIRLRPLLDSSGALCPVFEPWNTEGAEAISAGEPTCMEPFPGVFSPAKGYCIPYKDYKGVLLHEMLHALGLGHHEWDTCKCAKQNGTHSDDFVPTWGAVRTSVDVSDGSGRSLWRDDVEGLAALYGAHGLGPTSWRVVEYRSADGSDWEAVGQVPLAQRTTAPVAASSATDSDAPIVYLAYADESRYLRVARRNGDGGPGDWTDLGRVAPDLTWTRTDGREVPAGVTFQPPAVAYAPPNDQHPGMIGVAWLYEDETDEEAYIRWAVGSASGGSWTINGGRIAVKPRIVKLGYDPVHDWFLMTYLAAPSNSDDPRAYGWARTMTPSTGQLVGAAERLAPIPVGPQGGDVFENPGGGEPFVERLHDIGKPVCREVGGGGGPFALSTARCVIPVSTTGPNGPCLGWYYGTRTSDGSLFATLEREIFCLRDFGLNDMSLDPALPRAHVGSLVHYFVGKDPVAVPPPQGFDCASFGLCPTSPVTEARVRYRLETTGSGGGAGQITTQNQAASFDLGNPFDVNFIPGTSFLHPGPDDPGPWWPPALGSLGGSDHPFRIFVTEVDQRCGNGIVEQGEQCEPGNLGGASCQDAGFGAGHLGCTAECRFDTSDCGPPGCEGGPGEPNCDCVPVESSPFCGLDEDGCFPDGPGSFLGDGSGNADGLYCPDNFVGRSVCAFKKFGGQLRAVCQACPDSPGNGNAGYGCPCSRDSDCASMGQAGPTTLSFSGPMVPLRCFGSATEQDWASGPGLCLPSIDPSGSDITSTSLYGQNPVEEFERTRWLCKANCNAISDATHSQHVCVSKQLEPGIDFFNAACVDAGSCAGLLAGQCEDGGRRCDPNSNQCIDECDPAFNAPDGNPGCAIWGYPPGYECTEGWENPPRCVPSACAQNPLSTGLDQSFCEQFVNGGG